MAKQAEQPKIEFWRIATWFPHLKENQLIDLKIFRDELLKFNKAVSLISAMSEEKIDQVHFADSILGWNTMAKHMRYREIHDIGSGNGFPGLIIAILDREFQVRLIESDGRKCEFLKFMVQKLELQNVHIENKRLDKLAAGSIKAGVVRGFASLPKTLLSVRKLLGVGGQMFHFKGPEWSSELAALPQQLCSIWTTDHLADYRLPESIATHTILLSKKINE